MPTSAARITLQRLEASYLQHMRQRQTLFRLALVASDALLGLAILKDMLDLQRCHDDRRHLARLPALDLPGIDLQAMIGQVEHALQTQRRKLAHTLRQAARNKGGKGKKAAR